MSRIRLVFLSGPNEGESRSWPGGSIQVGRSRDNELVLPEGYPSASGRHAVFSVVDGEWVLRDLGSTNGTYVNGERLEPQIARPVGNGDEIGFGGDPIVRVGFGRNRRLLSLVAVLLAILVIVAGFGLRSLARIERGFESIAESVTERVFLLAIVEDGERAAVGTGFLVREPGWLATNAHVARLLADARSRGAQMVAIRSDRADAVFEIVDLQIHPRYREGEFRDDVGLVRLESAIGVEPLQLASEQRVGRLKRGASLAAVGFPAKQTDVALPRARLRVDVLEERRDGFLGVGLDISPGMSGSPIVDRTGDVVGVIVGGYFDESLNWGLTPEPLAEMLAEPR